MPYLRADAELRERFFSRLKLLFYAAAGLSQRFFDELSQMAVESCGEDILWMTGFGATETAPFALSTGPEGASAGVLGLSRAGDGAEAGAGRRRRSKRASAGRTSHQATFETTS